MNIDLIELAALFGGFIQLTNHLLDAASCAHTLALDEMHTDNCSLLRASFNRYTDHASTQAYYSIVFSNNVNTTIQYGNLEMAVNFYKQFDSLLYAIAFQFL